MIKLFVINFFSNSLLFIIFINIFYECGLLALSEFELMIKKFIELNNI